MKAEVVNREVNEVTIKVVVPEQDVEIALEKAYRKMRKDFVLDGFRKGRVPRAQIEKRFGVEVFYEDAANILLQQTYPLALEQQQLEAVSRPEIAVDQLEQGKPFIYSATVTVKPEVKLGKYRGLGIKKDQPKIEDKDVEQELDRIRNSRAKLVAVDPDVPAAKGDQVVIDFVGYLDGKEFEGGISANYPLVLGSETFIPGFEDQLIGAKAGDKVKVAVTMPEEYHKEDLAGKAVEFSVEVKEVKRKELPELDDEFAKDLGDFASLAALKDKIREQLETNAEQEATSKHQQQIIDKVREGAEADIPSVMVDTEVDAMVRQMETRFARQGMKLEDYLKFSGQDLDQLREQMRPEAENNVKTELVLDSLAEVENIKVEPEEVDREIEEMAQSYGQPPEAIKKALADGGQLSGLEQVILHRKVINWLVEHNTK